MKEKSRRIITALIIMCFVTLAIASGSSPKATNDTPATLEASTTAPQETSTPTEAPKSSENDFKYEITYVDAKTWENSLGMVMAQVVFEVTNTGAKPLYLSSGACDLEDENGALVKSVSLISVYPSVIEPGEKAYYYEETTLDVDEPLELAVLPRPDVVGAKVDTVRFPVTDIAFSDAQFGGIKMLGRVENTSSEEQTMIYVAAVLFDADGNPLGVIFTIIMEGLAPNAKVGFEASSMSMPRDITSDMIADYIIYAYPLQFQF